jgi:hypothetical protein
MNYREYQEAFAVIKEFYDHAWSTLIVLVSFIVGIPTALNIFQTIRGNKRIKNLEDKFNNYIKSIEPLEKDSKLALGGVYLHQGNMQLRDLAINSGEKIPNENPVYIFLSYLKALNYFLDTHIEKHIEEAVEQLRAVSDITIIPIDSLEEYPELKDVFEQVVDKLEDEKHEYKFIRDAIFIKSIFLKKRENDQ